MLGFLKALFFGIAVLNMIYAKAAKDDDKPAEMVLHLGYTICLLIMWAYI